MSQQTAVVRSVGDSWSSCARTTTTTIPVLILAAVLTGIGPAPTSFAVRQATLDELLSWSWSGAWERAEEAADGAALRDGMLTLPMTPAWTVRLQIHDEEDGRFRGTIGEQRIVGIWKYDRGVLVLCWQGCRVE